MVVVIFCKGDKEGESHTEEIESGSYGGQDQAMVCKHPVFYCTVTAIIQNVSIWKSSGYIRLYI